MTTWLLLVGVLLVLVAWFVWRALDVAARADAWADRLAADILGEWDRIF